MVGEFGYFFYQLGKTLTTLSRFVTYLRVTDDKDEERKRIIADGLIQRLELVIRLCKIVNLNLSAKCAERIYSQPSDERTYASLERDIEDLQSRLIDELDSIKFLYLDDKAAEFYERPNLFGEKVAANFADASYDIEEAGNCLAVGRYTACVMHLMRALEVALEAIGHGVGVPNMVELAKKNWTMALKAVGDQIGANDKAADAAWMPKSSFFKDARAQLFAVKVAWRDTSMHLEKKYDERDAKRIYDAVKNFMEHLAEHLDHSGSFTP